MVLNQKLIRAGAPPIYAGERGRLRPAHAGKALFCESQPSEKHGAVNEGAQQGVSEKWNRRNITAQQAAGGFGIEMEPCPETKVGNEEEQHRPKDSGDGHFANARLAPEPKTKAHEHCKAAINKGHERVQPDDQVTREHGEHGHEKSRAFIGKLRAAKKCERRNGCEIGRMWEQS